MQVITIGLGYIGLPSAILFANSGYKVTGIDKNDEVIKQLSQGNVHLEEPGLQQAFEQATACGNLQVQKEVQAGDVFLIAVPTPNQNDLYKSCDLTYVRAAMAAVIPHLAAGNTVIIESTIPPGTTEEVILPMIEQAGFTVGETIFLVHCPERVLPGKILEELRKNNRIIGGVTEACTKRGVAFYQTFVEGELLETNASAAELSKLMENTFRDVNIALANELVNIGHHLNINALDVIDMANRHPRVNIHAPGPGVGGHCLAVDPYFIVSKAPKSTPLIQKARSVNTKMPIFITEMTKQIMEKNKGKKITVLGITYKGNVDDIRESPALEIIERIKQETDYELSIFDPHVQLSWVEKEFSQAIEQSDLLLVLTDHNEFKQISAEMLTPMRQLVIFDTKNCIKLLPEANVFNLGNTYKIKDSAKETK